MTESSHNAFNAKGRATRALPSPTAWLPTTAPPMPRSDPDQSPHNSLNMAGLAVTTRDRLESLPPLPARPTRDTVLGGRPGRGGEAGGPVRADIAAGWRPPEAP